MEVGGVLINDRLSINHRGELFLTSTESFIIANDLHNIHTDCAPTAASAAASVLQSVSAWCCVQGQCYY